MSVIATSLLFGAVSVGACLVTASRVFGLRRIVKHSTKADVAFTAGSAFLLAGTLTGVTAAIMGGLMMALVLSVLRGIYRVSDRVQAGFDEMQRQRATVYPEEHNSEGWIYNQAPYA